MVGFWVGAIITLFVLYLSSEPLNPCAVDICEGSADPLCRRHCGDIQWYNWRMWVRGKLMLAYYFPLMIIEHPQKYVGRHRKHEHIFESETDHNDHFEDFGHSSELFVEGQIQMLEELHQLAG